MRKILIYTLAFLSGPFPVLTQGQHLRVKLENQLSAWGTLNFTDPVNYQFGGRYIPTLDISDSLKHGRILDMEISVNTFGNVYFAGKKYDEGEAVLKPYRLWVRYATPRLEIRLGLQKINFGSASILRPLMWFDKMDFRDPLQLTDGVYALLGRYYFQQNANIWFWALYGNDKSKGWEAVGTKKHTPEFGGRFQLPVDKGEVGLSFHHREAEFVLTGDSLPVAIETPFPEDKVGIDAKWDLGVGLSFESSVRHNKLQNPMIPEWETYLSLGLDYTIPMGNGLNITAEYFRYNSKAELNGSGSPDTYTTLAVNYPVGIMNNFTAIVYYNWNEKEWYRMVNLQRKYDYWSFYLLAFWNPNRFALFNSTQDRNLFGGKGIQLMAVVNF
jgi:hypothetical protein